MLPALFMVAYGVRRGVQYVDKMGVGPCSSCAQRQGCVSRGANVSGCVGKISGGVNIVRPIVALIHGEDCPHFCVWGQAAQPEGIEVH